MADHAGAQRRGQPWQFCRGIALDDDQSRAERAQPGIEPVQARVHEGDAPWSTRVTLEKRGIEDEDTGNGTCPPGLGESRVVVHPQIAGEPVQRRSGHARSRPQAMSPFKAPASARVAGGTGFGAHADDRRIVRGVGVPEERDALGHRRDAQLERREERDEAARLLPPSGAVRSMLVVVSTRWVATGYDDRVTAEAVGQTGDGGLVSSGSRPTRTIPPSFRKAATLSTVSTPARPRRPAGARGAGWRGGDGTHVGCLRSVGGTAGEAYPPSAPGVNVVRPATWSRRSRRWPSRRSCASSPCGARARAWRLRRTTRAIAQTGAPAGFYGNSTLVAL